MIAGASNGAGDATIAAPPWRGYVLALLALLASLALVLAYWRGAQQRELRAAQAEFVNDAALVAGRVQRQLDNYQLVSRGAVSLFASVAQPSHGQWKDYVNGLRIETQFPPLLGLGFAAYLDGSALQAMQLDLRAKGRGLFTLRPAGVREHYGPVTYLEPATPENIGAIGFDMYAHPARRAAMAAARDQGESRLTGAVELVQRPGQRSGLVIYTPVYRQGVVPGTPSGRRASLEGWVYAPLYFPHFMEDLLREPLQLRVVDLTAGSEVLYSGLPAGSADRRGVFRHSIELQPYGRRWRIDFETDSEQALARRSQVLDATLAIGILASVLVFGIAWVLARTESKAQAIARRMSDSFRRSELRFRSAMQYSAIGQALLDPAGRVVDANPALVALLGIGYERLLGVPFESLLVPAAAVAEHHDGEAVRRTTRQLQASQGDRRRRDLQLTYAPVLGDAVHDFVQLVQVEDVTERLRAEAQVQALNRSLEARVALRTRELTFANEELEAFAYSISHDLRAPLRAIDGFSRLLAERHGTSIDEAGRDYLVRIRNAAGRMGELIDALLKMSRLSRGDLKFERLDLSGLAEDVLRELRAAEPGRDVEVLIQPGLEASGDASLVRNLLHNLLGNAWKFTIGTPGARIELGAQETPPADAELDGFFVRDNGAGFAPDYSDKLFRPFQRLHNQEEFAGHGIGLASVKRILDRHGGTISAEAAVGQGACFRFTLPSAAGTSGVLL